MDLKLRAELCISLANHLEFEESRAIKNYENSADGVSAVLCARIEWGPENISACFDCSICLDFARDPVVTLCGYLYCWSCIYKWFNCQSVSPAPNELPQCPRLQGRNFRENHDSFIQQGTLFPNHHQSRPSTSGIQHLPSYNLNENEQNILDTG